VGGFHSHDFIEIHIPYRGLGEVVLPNREVRYAPGEFTLNPPHSPHGRQVIQGPTELLVIWLLLTEQSRDYIEQEFQNADLLLMHNERIVFPLPPPVFKLLDMIFAALAEQYSESRTLINYLFRSVVYYLMRSLLPDDKRVHAARLVQAPKITQLEDRLFYSRIDEYIQNNLHRDLSLESLAAHFGLSSRTLTRRYRKCRGVGIWDTVSNMRLSRVKTLLRNSPLSLAEIAARCGFRNAYYLSNCFRRKFGYPPGDYRRDPTNNM